MIGIAGAVTFAEGCVMHNLQERYETLCEGHLGAFAFYWLVGISFITVEGHQSVVRTMWLRDEDLTSRQGTYECLYYLICGWSACGS